MGKNKPTQLTNIYPWLKVLIKHSLSAYDEAFNDLIYLEHELAKANSSLSILATAIEKTTEKIDFKPNREVNNE